MLCVAAQKWWTTNNRRYDVCVRQAKAYFHRFCGFLVPAFPVNSLGSSFIGSVCTNLCFCSSICAHPYSQDACIVCLILWTCDKGAKRRKVAWLCAAAAAFFRKQKNLAFTFHFEYLFHQINHMARRWSVRHTHAYAFDVPAPYAAMRTHG